MRILIATFLTVAFVSSGFAQQSAPPTDQPAAQTPPPSDQPASQSPPPAAAAPAEAQQAPAAGRQGRQPTARRVACRDKARQQGLRGQQLRDNVALCVEEARLSCTKQAIEKNIPAEQRRDFIRNCAG